jgi:SpoVK/Ycf46/Vps4 family AAA+-type ATPase
MITIIVGVPGAGKTLYAMSVLHDEYKDRPVYHYNIPGITVDNWKELENPEKWHTVPNGSVVLIDEAHKVFPKRDHRVKEPDYIEAAAELRHLGLDLVLITQHPVDLDLFLRRRCARFIYLKKPLSKGDYATAYIWGEYNENYKDEKEQQKADSFTFNYPVEAYDRYKSSEMHTGKKYLPRSGRRALFALTVGFVVSIFSVLYFVNKVTGADDHEPVTHVVNTNESTHEPSSDYSLRYLPRIKNLPFTAPVYDEVVQARSFPRLNCISSATRCRCYSQQATVEHVQDDICRRIVNEGLFDFTRDDKGTNRG